MCILVAVRPIEMLKSLQGSGGSSGTAVDRWRENLAVILANRMQGDVKVIGQLGDMLWSTQMRVAAAHFWCVFFFPCVFVRVRAIESGCLTRVAITVTWWPRRRLGLLRTPTPASF